MTIFSLIHYDTILTSFKDIEEDCEIKFGQENKIFTENKNIDLIDDIIKNIQELDNEAIFAVSSFHLLNEKYNIKFDKKKYDYSEETKDLIFNLAPEETSILV